MNNYNLQLSDPHACNITETDPGCVNLVNNTVHAI
jgi:hypothetical protein